MYLRFEAHKFLDYVNMLKQHPNRASSLEIKYISRKNEMINIISKIVDEINKRVLVVRLCSNMHVRNNPALIFSHCLHRIILLTVAALPPDLTECS